MFVDELVTRCKTYLPSFRNIQKCKILGTFLEVRAVPRNGRLLLSHVGGFFLLQGRLLDAVGMTAKSFQFH